MGGWGGFITSKLQKTEIKLTTVKTSLVTLVFNRLNQTQKHYMDGH